MKIPKGMTEAETLAIIDKVLSSIAQRYTFGIYSAEDIKQEGFILALDALAVYDYSAPLENFLRTHLNNRIKNLKRNKHYRINTHCVNCKSFSPDCEACQRRQQTQERKKNLRCPIDIDVVNADNEDNLYSNTDLTNIEIEELTAIINKNLSVEYRRDYLKIKEGLYVPKTRRLEIEQIIKDILDGR